MKKLYQTVKFAFENKRRRRKKGRKLKKYTKTQIVAHIAEEAVELGAEPNNKEELADILTWCYHYMVKMGWDQKGIEEIAIEKLKRRLK